MGAARAALAEGMACVSVRVLSSVFFDEIAFLTELLLADVQAKAERAQSDEARALGQAIETRVEAYARAVRERLTADRREVDFADVTPVRLVLDDGPTDPG